MFEKNNSMFSNSKYGNLLTVILIIAIVAIIGIIIFIGYSIYKKFYTEKGAEEAVAQFESIAGTNNNVTDNSVKQDLSAIGDGADNTTGSGTTAVKTTYKGFNVVGTIQIPKINLKYPVLQKVTKKSLETSVAFLYGPGLNEIGNTTIVGHNYRNGTFFSNNKKLVEGDKVYITDNSGTKVTYVIYKTYTTAPEDSEYLDRDTQGKREISLITCTDDAKSRLIIWAREQ